MGGRGRGRARIWNLGLNPGFTSYWLCDVELLSSRSELPSLQMDAALPLPTLGLL